MGKFLFDFISVGMYIKLVIDMWINSPSHERMKIDGINRYDKSYLRQKMSIMGTEEVNNEIMRMNAVSMIGDRGTFFLIPKSVSSFVIMKFYVWM